MTLLIVFVLDETWIKFNIFSYSDRVLETFSSALNRAIGIYLFEFIILPQVNNYYFYASLLLSRSRSDYAESKTLRCVAFDVCQQASTTRAYNDELMKRTAGPLCMVVHSTSRVSHLISHVIFQVSTQRMLICWFADLQLFGFANYEVQLRAERQQWRLQAVVFINARTT